MKFLQCFRKYSNFFKGSQSSVVFVDFKKFEFFVFLQNVGRGHFFEYSKGTGVTEALIYLWKYDDKIVVSDIDGTVTRSDVVGHISNVLYIDYTHSGIHNLYDQIQR